MSLYGEPNSAAVATLTNPQKAAVELTEVVLFLLNNAVREQGTQITKAPNFAAHIAVSERLVTGQNPASATPVAELAMRVFVSRSVVA